MSRQTRANRKSSPIDSWEDKLNSILRDPARSVRFSEESVRISIRRQPVRADDGICSKVSLHCPLGRGSRIEIPVRAQKCEHLQCFDLTTYLKMHDRQLLAVKRHGNKLFGADASVGEKYISWDCPICKGRAEVGDLHVDGYFDSLLQGYNDLQKVEEVEIMSDGSHRPVVRPKVEMFPVSDSPFSREDDGEAEAQVDEKPLAAHQTENADEEYVSADAMQITDLSLEEIRRLPETHQLCKDVKRRLLNKFKHMEKRKSMKEVALVNYPTLRRRRQLLWQEGLGTSGADDATLSSRDAEDAQLSCEGSRDAQLSLGDADEAALSNSAAGEQAHRLQIEVEQLRRALSDADHAKLALQAQNERLQADLLASQKTLEANEQEKAQLRVEKRRLETEKAALHLKLEVDDGALAAEQKQQAEKAQTPQSKISKFQKMLADKERENLAQREEIRQLEYYLREYGGSERRQQLRMIEAENANLYRKIVELETSVSSCRASERQATEECGRVSVKRGKTETKSVPTEARERISKAVSKQFTVKRTSTKSPSVEAGPPRKKKPKSELRTGDRSGTDKRNAAAPAPRTDTPFRTKQICLTSFDAEVVARSFQ